MRHTVQMAVLLSLWSEMLNVSGGWANGRSFVCETQHMITGTGQIYFVPPKQYCKKKDTVARCCHVRVHNCAHVLRRLSCKS